MPHARSEAGGGPPSLGVIVPHYGDPGPTLDLLDLLASEPEASAVVVVDDCSPEPFPGSEDPRVRTVRRPVNGGFGSTVNEGARHLETDLLLVLNSDVSFAPGFVADLLAAAAPWQPAVVSPRVVESDGEEAWTGRRFPTVGHQATEWLTPLARFRSRRLWHRMVGHDVAAHRQDRDRSVDWVVGAAMVIPREPFAAVGGFDERFHMNCEEIDLQRRLRERGVPSVVVPAPTLVHRGGGSSASDVRRGWLCAARLRYADKWGGRRRLQATLSLATGVNLAWNLTRRARGVAVSPWRVARTEWGLVWDPDPSRDTERVAR